MSDADEEMMRCLGFAMEMKEVIQWPVWCCDSKTFLGACAKGWLKEVRKAPMVPRWGMSSVVYGLTPEGQTEFMRLLYAKGTVVGSQMCQRSVA